MVDDQCYGGNVPVRCRDKLGKVAHATKSETVAT